MEQDPTTDQQVSDYYHDIFQSIKDGNQEFVIRNFDADFGRVYDLYSYAGKVTHHGYVHQEYGYGCTAYTSDPPKPLNREPLHLEHAKLLLKESIKEAKL